jgi:hypothetical protein
MKTPEELADHIEKQAILCVSLLAMNDGEYFAAKKAYKAGYQAGMKRGTIDTEKRILNEYFDQYGAEEHATFAVAVNAYEVKDDDENT